MVTSERRRRTGLRTIHLSAPATSRYAWPPCATGFDEALPQTDRIGGAGRPRDHSRGTRAARHRPRHSSSGTGYELDLVAHALLREGRPIHLRPKEFALLAMLAAHPGRAYTRRQLLDRVWGSRAGRRSPDGRRPCPLAAGQDRATAGPAGPPGHGPRRGLPAGSPVNGALTRRQTAVHGPGPRVCAVIARNAPDVRTAPSGATLGGTIE